MSSHSGASLRESKANRLISEKSPYLLQHAFNPVDWYPWGEEAFSKARRENKPIFLSIGYSSCHWCHVMERESFEDPDTAKLLNESFVSIKVDREERPDVDLIYMKAVQAITGSGGWPLSVFLTPDLSPFYGGTYFPLVSRYGMPGFASILKSIAQSWKKERGKLVQSATQLRATLEESYSSQKPEGSKTVDESVLTNCFGELAQSFDQIHGGFGTSPKFPTPSIIFFLLRYYHRTHERAPLIMTQKTLDAMLAGGIYDQLAGGFHRYSTDRFWLVPHFEKMLYDNALLITAYCEAFLLTGSASYKRAVFQTLEWVETEMVSGEGAFVSSKDADSIEGEGSYYVWTKKEVENALMPRDDASPFRTSADLLQFALKYYSITESGNFENKSSILTATKSLDSFALEFGISEAEAESALARVRKALLEQRRKRPSPQTDDKILTSWNAMMISALCKAYCVFGKEDHLKAAIRAADFILEKMTLEKADDKALKLMHRYRDGEVKEEGTLEDFAYLGISLVDLYETTFDLKYLDKAIAVCDAMILNFYDNRKDCGGFFETPAKKANLIARPKEAYDGAIPSSNSMASLMCLKIGELTSKQEYKSKATDTFRTFWNNIEAQPASFTEMLCGLMFQLAPPKEIVVSGDVRNEYTQQLIHELRGHFLPNSVTVLADARLDGRLQLVEGRIPNEGETCKIFVCSNYSCKLPARTKAELEVALKDDLTY